MVVALVDVVGPRMMRGVVSELELEVAERGAEVSAEMSDSAGDAGNGVAVSTMGPRSCSGSTVTASAVSSYHIFLPGRTLDKSCVC
jgi:hypothetical protein